MKKGLLLFPIIILIMVMLSGCSFSAFLARVNENKAYVPASSSSVKRSSSSSQASSSIKVYPSSSSSSSKSSSSSSSKNVSASSSSAQKVPSQDGQFQEPVPFFDLSQLALPKDTSLLGDFGGCFAFTDDCRYSTSSGKTARNGNQTTFVGGCLLPKNGSFNWKSIQITVKGACILEVYSSRSTSGAEYGNLSLVNSDNQIIQTIETKMDIYMEQFIIPSKGTYALCVLDYISSVTIWGLEIKSVN